MLLRVEWFISQNSHLQISKLAECLAASIDSAHKGRDFIVDALVCLEVSELCEAFVTSEVPALVRSLAGMLPFMGLQVKVRKLGDKQKGTGI